ncbi:MAG: GNAT family N-acetyltransferase [Bacteroidetes bacterium HGW-Bacteroidetes-9]|jgi:diamine N-acetyltransferase|nr:MAG: GNAT family N-acetyltransferase [Bacteroidetes bacterium HGW-Bacteroidetes-9]
MKGKQISLRAPEPADIDLIYAWENDPSVWQVSNTTAPYSRFDIEQFVLNTNHDIFAAKQLRLMITDNEKPGEPVGAIDLFDFDPLHRRAGVGILIASSERGKGYATEALSMLKEYSFNTLNLHQLYCHISTENKGSIHIFSKTGFEICGTCKDWTRAENIWKDAFFMQLINHK